MNWLFKSGGQSTGASASATVLPVSIQGWFPLGWTGWISLLAYLSFLVKNLFKFCSVKNLGWFVLSLSCNILSSFWT